MKFLNLLNLLEEIENLMANFYYLLYKKYSFDLRVAPVLYSLFLDEKSHLNLVRYQKRVVWPNQGHFKDVEIDLKEVGEFVERVKGILKNIDNISLKEALKIALELEQSAAEKHLQNVTLKANPQFGLFLTNLHSDDKKHANKLERLLEREDLLMENPKVAMLVG